MRGAALRAAATCAVLTAVLYGWGGLYSRMWCRVIEVQLGLMQDHFRYPTVALARVDGQALLRMQATVGDRLRNRFPGIPAGETVWGSTLDAYLHSHLILVMALLAAWPVPSWRHRCRLLLAGLAATAISTSLDLPFALTGLVLGEVYAVFDPGLLRTALPVRYFDFLQSGGRLLLPLVAAGIVLLLLHPDEARPSPDRGRAPGRRAS